MNVEWKPFGWQHFQLMIPHDWDLTEEHGYEAKGYCKLDNLENTCLEIRWEKYKGAKDLLTFITKHAKKIGWEDANIRLLFEDQKIYCIEKIVNGLGQLIIFIYNKSISNRIYVLRYFFQNKDIAFKLVKKICNSFQDNFNKDKSLWAFYEHNYYLPSFYRKSVAKINAGNKMVVYSSGNLFVYVWTISLVSKFCPHKPFSNDAINAWLPELLKKEFDRDVILPEWNYLLNPQITSSSWRGRLKFKNLFHLNHKWVIAAKYNKFNDILKIAIANFSSNKKLKNISPFEQIVGNNV